MLVRSLGFVFMLLFFFSTAFAVEYYAPTPEDNSKISNNTIYFLLYDEGENITNCDLYLNNEIYNMTYSGGFCNYTLTGMPMAITDYEFLIFYDSWDNSTNLRSFKYFPTATQVEQVPLAGAFTYIIILLFILGGLFIRK